VSVAVDTGVKRNSTARGTHALLLLAVGLFTGLVVFGAVSFEGEGHAAGVSGDPNLVDGVRIHANLEKMVPGDPQLVLRLDFEPRGRFAQDGVFLAQRLRVIAVGGAGLVDESFAAGGMMTPRTLPVALEGGDVSQYPFDSYSALFGVRVLTGDGAAVPSVVVADGSMHGYSVDIARSTREPNGGNDLTISVSRAPATLLFAGFIMLLMWTVTLLALLLSAKLIRTSATIDTPLISLLGVLLFAFTALRNSMPNAPALGALADYLSYFWCEVALGLGLVALLVFRIRRT
jgi:Domain of unknown function (DUF4436)